MSRRALSHRHAPVKLPVVGTIVWGLALDRIDAAAWGWGVFGTLTAFAWGFALYDMWTAEQVKL